MSGNIDSYLQDIDQFTKSGKVNEAPPPCCLITVIILVLPSLVLSSFTHLGKVSKPTVHLLQKTPQRPNFPPLCRNLYYKFEEAE